MNHSTPNPNPPPPSPSKPNHLITRLRAYQAAYASRTPPANFDRALWSNITILSASLSPTTTQTLTGHATFALTFPETYTNTRGGQVHGGAIALLFDGLCTATLGMLCGKEEEEEEGGEGEGKKKGLWVGGEATRSLSVEFFCPVRVGEGLVVECEIVRVGVKGATVVGRLRRGEGGDGVEGGGEVLAVCLMGKAVGGDGVRARL